MSGCVWEYTASFLSGGTTTYTTGMPTGSSSKYVTLYTGSTGKPGDATTETSGWNGDYADFVASSNPVFVRGYNCSAVSNAGLFAFNDYNGNCGSYERVPCCVNPKLT